MLLLWPVAWTAYTTVQAVIFIFAGGEMAFISALIVCSSPEIESPSYPTDVVYRNDAYDRPWQPRENNYAGEEHYDTIDEPSYDYTRLQLKQPQQPATSHETSIPPTPPPRDYGDYLDLIR